MFRGTKAGHRFSLLLLDEGENYLQDYVVECQWPLETVDGNWKSESKMPGTLRVCTKSLFFEPDDFRVPVVRFPCRLISEWKQDGSRSLQITSSGLSKMKANNTDQPYVHERRKNSVWTFTLLYASFSQFSTLFSKQMACKDDEDQLQEQVRELVQKTMFDTSRLVNFSESIKIECAVTHILPLIREPGKLVVTDERLYYQPMTNVSGSNVVLSHPLKKIMSIVRRRSALRDCGLEVFFMFVGEENSRHVWNRSCAFFEFPQREEREGVLRSLMEDATMPEIKRFVLDATADIVKYATKRWQDGKLSNFDYIFFINLASGRTVSDLRQWPVFPWILKDYEGSHLDLNDPASYRDLSKPIGTLNPERLARFKERFQQMPRDGFPPPFLYGTHYSTPGYVMYWLVRESPSHVLRLQNGKFDAPDRMFYSIPSAWESVMSSPADVRELIPEFFVQDTAFLINKHRLAFGKRQNGKSVDDVELPKWAKSPADFLAKNRAALESEYVSKHLHLWIDLIFGYKQTGKAAVEADNVFYYLSYEGAVDVDSITDPVERRGLEAQINEFGQTPKQLFTEAHPQRKHFPPTPHPREYMTAECLSPRGIQDQECMRTVGCTHVDKRVLSFCMKALEYSANPTCVADSDSRSSSPPVSRPEPSSLMADAKTEDRVIEEERQPIPMKLASTNSFIYEEVTGKYGFNPKEKGQLSRPQKKWQNAGNKIRVQKAVVDGFRSAVKTRTRIALTANQEAPPTAGQKVWYPALFRGMQLHREINFAEEAVRSVALSSFNGGTLYSAGDGGTLKMFSLENGDQLRSAKLEREEGRAMPLCALDLLPNRKTTIQPLALVGSRDAFIYAYSIEMGKTIGFFKAHEDAVSVVRVMKGRDRTYQLITASDDATIKIWTASEGRAPWDGLLPTGVVPEHRVEGLGSPVVALDYAPEGNLLISGTRQGVVSAWDLRSPSELLWNQERHGQSVQGLSVLPDGEHVLSGFEDGCLNLWSMKKPEDTIKPVICPTGIHGCISDGHIALLGQEDGQILVWDIGQALGKSRDAQKQLVPNSEGFFPPLICAQSSPPNSLCAEAERTSDGREILWVAACQEGKSASVFRSSE